MEDEEITDTTANETDEAAPLASEEKGAEPNEDRGTGGGDEAGGDGRDPEGGSILWAIPVLILIIFVAFDRYL